MEEYRYTHGPFSTIHVEYSFAAHKDLREQAENRGWHRVVYTRREMPVASRVWVSDHNIQVMRLSYFNEIWFECEEDAIYFKLTWC